MPLILRTPEQWRDSAAKGHATRRSNKARDQRLRDEAVAYANGLGAQIKALENRLSELQRLEPLQLAAARLTKTSLLREHEIVAEALPWATCCGVYFLIGDGRVQYVGQSVNVLARIAAHEALKKFTHYTYIPCKAAELDVLESLYIHLLQPPMNGNCWDKSKSAPLTLKALLERLA